jgi:hypothetical protein
MSQMDPAHPFAPHFPKVKVKLSLCFTEHHTMKAYWESGGTTPRILDLGTGWMWVVSFMPRPLYPQRKSSRYTLNRREDGSQSRPGRGGENKNSQPLQRLRQILMLSSRLRLGLPSGLFPSHFPAKVSLCISVNGFQLSLVLGIYTASYRPIFISVRTVPI